MPLVPYTLYIWCFSCSNSNQIQKKEKKKEGNNKQQKKKSLLCEL